ncbi:MAG: sulfite exporter TauE/SafE family protein [Flavobacteriales bacterium]|nr:sulfite exporter TauE/SafE family protein [Flavobacteriales bacterium]
MVSLLYSAVGHGGASGYLALMSLWSFPVLVMKPTALILNLFVSAIAFVAYARKGHFRSKLLLAFAITSVPMAFLGGGMHIDASLYRKILGVLLIFAVLRMMGLLGGKTHSSTSVHWLIALLLGAGIGFFSGLIGIGGGVILTPLILLLGWGDMKEAAAVSAAFIWVNSAAALIGFSGTGVHLGNGIYLMAVLALVGGLLGAYLGSVKWDQTRLKYVLALVLVIASAKLIFT